MLIDQGNRFYNKHRPSTEKNQAQIDEKQEKWRLDYHALEPEYSGVDRLRTSFIEISEN